MSKSWRPNLRKRIDSNQKAIVDELIKIPGVSVMRINGTVDICVGYRSSNFLFEIKKNKYAKMTDSQVKFFANWKGQIQRVETLDEILQTLAIESDPLKTIQFELIDSLRKDGIL